jgi:transcriptional regulator with XRE-family HTH domain
MVTKYQRIKDLREDMDLTQTQISEQLNISQRAYSHFETGTRGIPTEILIKLADIFEVSLDYLVGRTDKK